MNEKVCRCAKPLFCMKSNFCSHAGFTLVELLMAVITLAAVLAGLIQVFIRCSTLAELSHHKTLVMSEAQSKMEEIRSHDFDVIAADYVYGGALNPFDLNQLTGKGVIYINDSTADLLRIEIVISWRDKYNRMIGEDLDLDGILDAGPLAEDRDGNGKLSSIATIVSLVAARF